MIMCVETRFLASLEMTQFLNIIRADHFLFQINRYNSVVSMKIKPSADFSAIPAYLVILQAKFYVPAMRAESTRLILAPAERVVRFVINLPAKYSPVSLKAVQSQLRKNSD